MNEKEYNVERAKIDVRYSESALWNAEQNLTHGRAEAKIAIDKKVAELQMAVTKAQAELDGDRARLAMYQSILEQGFEK
jgi:multidrug resistance efflux pump